MSALAPIIESLPAQINAEHQAAFGKAREALEHARRAGELLLQAKAAVKHGEWLPWLRTHCYFSARTAQGYMQLAFRWAELEKCATVADLGLRDALVLLGDPEAEFRRRVISLARQLMRCRFLGELVEPLGQLDSLYDHYVGPPVRIPLDVYEFFTGEHEATA